MKKITVSKAIGEALHEEMLRDDKVFIMGEDMAVMGNVFAITKGFLEEFGPKRVIDTPISEEGFVGMAVGAAMRGMRPVVELMYDDFATECADPLFNQAAKIRYMTGGQCHVPMVLRAPMGAGRRNAGQHSQSLENFFCHFPGLKVVAPCTAQDAKGLLKSAIRDDDPVIFLEHKLLYAHKEQIPEEEYTIPLGQADIKREGKDITILTIGATLYRALEAAKVLEEKYGMSAEVIDARSLVPFNYEKVLASVKKTGRIVIAGDATARGSFLNDLARNVNELAFDYLDAPAVVLGSRDWITPAYELEYAFFPQVDSFIDIIHEKIVPLPGHVPTRNFTEAEQIRRAKEGI